MILLSFEVIIQTTMLNFIAYALAEYESLCFEHYPTTAVSGEVSMYILAAVSALLIVSNALGCYGTFDGKRPFYSLTFVANMGALVVHIGLAGFLFQVSTANVQHLMGERDGFVENIECWESRYDCCGYTVGCQGRNPCSEEVADKMKMINVIIGIALIAVAMLEALILVLIVPFVCKSRESLVAEGMIVVAPEKQEGEGAGVVMRPSSSSATIQVPMVSPAAVAAAAAAAAASGSDGAGGGGEEDGEGEWGWTGYDAYYD